MCIECGVRDFDNIVKGNFCCVIWTKTRLKWFEEKMGDEKGETVSASSFLE